MKIETSIVMPCLNEAETLEVCIKKAFAGLEKAKTIGEVIVADNGSTDGSIEIAERLGARIVRVVAKGYGNALMGGIAAAKGEFVIMGDADDSYDFGEVHKFINHLRSGDDLVMGCRLPKGGGRIIPRAMPWKNRWIGNPVLSFLGRLFFRCPAHDFHCGLRGFRREAIEQLDLQTTGMEFASEMVIKATLKKLKIAEVPITLHKDGRSRPPHLKPWRDGWRHLRFMLLYSPRWLFLMPGVALFGIGLFLSSVLAFQDFQIGVARLSVGSLAMACSGIIVGFQFVAFAFFTKIFGVVSGLLPEDSRMNRLFKYFSLERGIFLSFTVLICGLMSIVYATFLWEQKNFGPVNWESNLRLLIAGSTFVILGAQGLISSFFLSILGLKTKKTAHLTNEISMSFFDKYLRKCRIEQARPFLASGGKLLDIGTSDGMIFKTIGFLSRESVGIDPLKNTEIITDNFKFISGKFPSDLCSSVEFDFITMLAVLEHFPDEQLPSVVEGCKRFLKTGGKLIITVPSKQVDSILAFLVKIKFVKGMSIDEHHGFESNRTPLIFAEPFFRLVCHKKFQLGLNNLFIFEKL